MRKIVSLSILLLLVIALLSAPINQLMAQGDVTNFTNVMVSNFYRALPRAALTVTDNGVVNTTGTHQRLTAASAVGTSGDNLTIKPAGAVLVLVNVGSNTITFTETANIKSAGNVALGAGDSASFVSDGVDWFQFSASNN